MSREAGKGSTYRAVNLKRFNENWDRIFGTECDNCSEDEEQCQDCPLMKQNKNANS